MFKTLTECYLLTFTFRGPRLLGAWRGSIHHISGCCLGGGRRDGCWLNTLHGKRTAAAELQVLHENQETKTSCQPRGWKTQNKCRFPGCRFSVGGRGDMIIGPHSARLVLAHLWRHFPALLAASSKCTWLIQYSRFMLFRNAGLRMLAYLHFSGNGLFHIEYNNLGSKWRFEDV